MSGPAVCSWSPGRLDMFFLRDRNLVHTYWDGSETGTETLTDRLLYGQPAAVSWGPGRIDLFVRDRNSGTLLHKWLSDGRWHPWEDLGGTLHSDPCVASWGVNRLEVFTTGFEGTLVYRVWDGATW